MAKVQYRNCLKSLASPETKALGAHEVGHRGLISLQFASYYYA